MRRRNLPYILSLILAVFFTFLLCLFFRQSLLIVFLLLLLLLPIVSVAATRHAAGRLKVSLRLPAEELSVPADVRITLRLENPTLFPLLNCEFKLLAQNRFYPPMPPQEIVVAAEARSVSETAFPIHFTAAGMFCLDLEELYVTDYLHLWSFKLTPGIRRELPLLPSKRELAPVRLTKASVESEDSVVSPDGERSSEISELREYRPGDRLRDVHWKMTARTDQMMIKEYEHSRDLYFLLLPELEKRSLQESLISLYSLGHKLIRDKESYRVALYHCADHSFEFLPVSSGEELRDVMYRLYLEPVENSSSAYVQLMRQKPELNGVIRIHGGNILPPETPEVY
ncbi:MAG: DUF58 domain-containing protein [Lachnospiraceae bacterium]|nr:DUF58 domain-containing protein [Lachnospiraceae bacterium]